MHRFPQIWNLLLLESRNYIYWRTLTSIFVAREVLQFGGGKVRRRNEQQQHVWPASLTTSQRTPQLRMQHIQFVWNCMYFFKISQTFKSLDLHCLRQMTVTESDKGLAKIAEGASSRRHAETSPVKVKDTHLMNNKLCCVHNASTVPWTSAGQFGRPRGVRGRPWYDLWRPRCVISHPMDVRGLPPGRPPSGRPRDTQFGIDWSLLPSGCPQGVRTAEVQPITARTHYGQEVGLPTVRPKPEVDVP